ncbi:MAG: YigZ family protein [Bacteroidota bacterium]
MSETLYEVKNSGTSLLKDRGSKFHGVVHPCHDLTQAQVYLEEIKRQFHDARHHCYAYRLGKLGDTSYSTDDGEPAHSAGDPILGAIKSAQLTNVWVGVIRYFGGTKLGVRGLIEAYRGAAEEALLQVNRQAVLLQAKFELIYPYERTSEIRRILHPYPCEEQESVYTTRVRQVLGIQRDLYPELQAQLEAADFDYQTISID